MIAPDYRLAPEHPFPAALDDAEASYLALLEGGCPPHRIAFAGDSAGGGLCLALALRLKAAGQPLPSSLTLFSPWTDLTQSRLYSPASEPVLQAEWTRHAARLYAGDHALDTPLLSPVFGDLSGLPPMLIQVGGDEILLNDSERLATPGAPTGYRGSPRHPQRPLACVSGAQRAAGEGHRGHGDRRRAHQNASDRRISPRTSASFRGLGQRLTRHSTREACRRSPTGAWNTSASGPLPRRLRAPRAPPPGAPRTAVQHPWKCPCTGLRWRYAPDTDATAQPWARLASLAATRRCWSHRPVRIRPSPR